MGSAVASVLQDVGLVPEAPDTSAQEEALRKQEERIQVQEAATKQKESALAKETQKRIIARRGGGQRMLLSQERPDAELGIQQTLGG